MAANEGLRPHEGVGGGAGAQVLVVVEDDEAVAVLDRDDGAGEAAVLPGRGGALLGEGGVLVHIAAAEALDGGDEVGADALRGEAGLEAGHRVHRPGPAVGAHRHPGHRLDAPGEYEVLPARTDLGGGQVDGLQARGTEAVLLDPGDGVGQPGGDGGDAGDVGALVTERADDPEDDVVDGGRVQVRESALDLVDEADDQVDRLGAVQGAVGLAAAAGVRIAS